MLGKFDNNYNPAYRVDHMGIINFIDIEDYDYDNGYTVCDKEYTHGRNHTHGKEFLTRKEALRKSIEIRQRILEELINEFNDLSEDKDEDDYYFFGENSH